MLDRLPHSPAIFGLSFLGVVLAGTLIRDRPLEDRRALLDLGTRNRLVDIPLRTKNTRVIELVDEKSSEVFRLLGEGNLRKERQAEGIAKAKAAGVYKGRPPRPFDPRL